MIQYLKDSTFNFNLNLYFLANVISMHFAECITETVSTWNKVTKTKQQSSSKQQFAKHLWLNTENLNSIVDKCFCALEPKRLGLDSCLYIFICQFYENWDAGSSPSFKKIFFF